MNDVIDLGRIFDDCGRLTEKDLTPWEREFMQSVRKRTEEGLNLDALSEKQIAVLDKLHKKHFSKR